MQFLEIFMRLIALSAFILCNFHVYKWEKAYIKDFNAWRFLMIFFIYLDEGRGWGVLMHVYVLEHIVSLATEPIDGCLRNLVGMKYSLVIRLFGKPLPGVDPGWGKNRSRGSPSLQCTSSDRKATATNRMHSNDLEACGKKCLYFWFYSEVKFFVPFWRLFWT